MKILTFRDIRDMVRRIGLENFLNLTVSALEEDFRRWNSFILSPRHATHYPHGVIELMPCADQQFYSFKYVNGHPNNVRKGKLSIIAIGQLSDVDSGYPLMLCDMTLLTALRTAATGVLAAKYLARSNAKSMAMIGTGAQSEFQTVAFANFFPLESIRFFDLDAQAMTKFSRNLAGYPFELKPCNSIAEAVYHADIVVTATAAKKRQVLFGLDDIAAGTHIQAMGGDCPGKTEFAAVLLNRVKLVVEYKPQNLIEGEVQQCDAGAIHAELWELIGGVKPGRENEREITFFDTVGFALEDHSILRLVYQLAERFQQGAETPILPSLSDPKDLFGLLNE
ncbi:MAG: ornithine cyclodeaminase [Gammaproteobacteria bacterium]